MTTFPIKFITGKHDRGKGPRQDRFYPACKFSKMLCELIRRDSSTTAKCLTPWQLDKLRSYGYEIEIIVEEE
jgi:hypothetical protein